MLGIRLSVSQSIQFRCPRFHSSFDTTSQRKSVWGMEELNRRSLSFVYSIFLGLVWLFTYRCIANFAPWALDGP